MPKCELQLVIAVEKNVFEQKRYKTFILRTLVSNLLSSYLFFPYLPANVLNIHKLPAFLGLTLVGLCLILLLICISSLVRFLSSIVQLNYP